MKIISINRRDLLGLLSCVLVAACAAGVLLTTSYKVVSTAAEARDIPIYCVECEEKKVAISFDAAWGNEQTEQLLDILEQNKVRATFFLVGEWVDKYPDSVKSIAAHGHDVENHSDTHAHMPQLSQSGMTDEITQCNEKIKAITGKSPTLFRPPYGDYNNAVVSAVKDSKMYCIQWDIDSLDWKDPTPAQMVNRITSKLTNGSIILMHNGAKNTPEALPMIIEAIKAEGYELVPISELVPKGEYTTDHQGRMHISDNPTTAAKTEQ